MARARGPERRDGQGPAGIGERPAPAGGSAIATKLPALPRLACSHRHRHTVAVIPPAVPPDALPQSTPLGSSSRGCMLPAPPSLRQAAPDFTIQVIPFGHFATEEYRSNRIRLWLGEDGKIDRVPRIG